MNFTRTIILLLGLFSMTIPLFGQVMNSGNYSLESDSINFGGGLSTSSSYELESTMGESATGYGSSASYAIHAGYQQMSAVFLSMSSAADVTLAPSIPNAGGGVANGSTTVTVTTDNSAGYELFIRASSSPALVSSSDSFADYTPSGIDPDFAFTVSPSDSEFGFTPEGVDIAPSFLDDGSSCSVGLLDTSDACWSPLRASDDLIAQRASANYPAGSDTILKFKVEAGAASIKNAGVYVATSTVTAVPL